MCSVLGWCSTRCDDFFVPHGVSSVPQRATCLAWIPIIVPVPPSSLLFAVVLRRLNHQESLRAFPFLFLSHFVLVNVTPTRKQMYSKLGKTYMINLNVMRWLMKLCGVFSGTTREWVGTWVNVWSMNMTMGLRSEDGRSIKQRARR